MTGAGHEPTEPPTDGLLKTRGDLRASSSKQSPEVARVRPLARRRIPVCRTCLDLLDLVVAEWRHGDLDDEVEVRCVSCGATAHLWVEPDRGAATSTAIEVDATGDVIRVAIAGTADGETMEIVMAEVAGLDVTERPVVIDLGATHDLSPAGRAGLEDLVGTTRGVGGRIGIVAEATWVGAMGIAEIPGIEVIGETFLTVAGRFRNPRVD